MSAEDTAESSGALPVIPEIPDPYVGTVLCDRYRVQHKIGAGGMGAVYLAEHIVIERKVAIKILSQDFATKADLVQRFIQEARAAARIGHENIVEVYDFGETASGSVFFAME
ncbi:MAG TPA: protein kinase, partial [Pseudomonadota bacterium]|nr:protein kinase [Pseudomonadota bacterium]